MHAGFGTNRLYTMRLASFFPRCRSGIWIKETQQAASRRDAREEIK